MELPVTGCRILFPGLTAINSLSARRDQSTGRYLTATINITENVLKIQQYCLFLTIILNILQEFIC